MTWGMDHSLTRETSEHACTQTHAMQKAPLSLSLGSPRKRSLNAANLRRASRCKHKPSCWDGHTNLWCCDKAQAREEKTRRTEDLTAAHWKHPTISRSNSSSNKRAHFLSPHRSRVLPEGHLPRLRLAAKISLWSGSEKAKEKCLLFSQWR